MYKKAVAFSIVVATIILFSILNLFDKINNLKHKRTKIGRSRMEILKIIIYKMNNLRRIADMLEVSTKLHCLPGMSSILYEK